MSFQDRIDQEALKELVISLCATMTVSGFETRSTAELRTKAESYFDESYTDRVGNHIFLRRCGRQNAPLCMIDVHYDEIGMMVREVCEGGFLRMAPVGGLSPAVLQGADVTVWGQLPLRGVITSTPPHLRLGEEEALPDVEELLVDTGYPKEELEQLAPVGTPIGFSPRYGELANQRLLGKGFDNKACGACALYALMHTDREELAADVALCFASYEEISRQGGVSAAAYGLNPDYAMVLDVNFATVPKVAKWETIPMGKGISLARSAATDRRLTDRTEALCRQEEIPYLALAAPASTGTDSVSLGLVRNGVPVVDVGLPLASMHTYNEMLDLKDAEALCRLCHAFICDRGLAESFGAACEILKEEVPYEA